jgi:hypothetical protein
MLAITSSQVMYEFVRDHHRRLEQAAARSRAHAAVAARNGTPRRPETRRPRVQWWPRAGLRWRVG